jgi:hypothetical protein
VFRRVRVRALPFALPSLWAAEPNKPPEPLFPYGAIYFRKSNLPERDRDHHTAAEAGMNTFRHCFMWSASAVITFDDCTRPTPTCELAPLVVEELLAAGVPKDRTLFLASYGTHRPLERDEVVRTLGEGIIRQYRWVNHQIWENCRDVGTTSRKNNIVGG